MVPKRGLFHYRQKPVLKAGRDYRFKCCFWKRARIGRPGRTQDEREFDEKIVIDRDLEVIDQILAGAARTPPNVPPADNVAAPDGTTP